MVKGGGREKRIIREVEFDKAQGTWAYLVRRKSEEGDMGWIEEFSLTLFVPSVDI